MSFIFQKQKKFIKRLIGENWTNISSSLPNNTVTDIAIHPSDENRVWITFSGYSNGNKVFYTSDGGTNWINISDDLPNIPANCILFYPLTKHYLQELMLVFSIKTAQ